MNAVDGISVFGKRTLAGVLLLWCGMGPWSSALAAERDLLDTFFDLFESDSEPDPSSVTSDHVFRVTEDVISEIEILREELGVSDFVVEAELVPERSSVHAYAKTLELRTKIVNVQRRFGVPLAAPGQIPFKEVMSGDVAASLRGILDELRQLKAAVVIDRQIAPAALVPGKTPSLVYQSLTDASTMLDGLVGQALAPDDVYLNCQLILDELGLVAGELNVSLAGELPAVDGPKTPTEVAQQLLRATYKVIDLQTRLGMEASAVPSLTLVRVSPAENYDATSLLLAEMARLKWHLRIAERRGERNAPSGRRPADVFALVLHIIQGLDRVVAGV